MTTAGVNETKKTNDGRSVRWVTGLLIASLGSICGHVWLLRAGGNVMLGIVIWYSVLSAFVSFCVAQYYLRSRFMGIFVPIAGLLGSFFALYWGALLNVWLLLILAQVQEYALWPILMTAWIGAVMVYPSGSPWLVGPSLRALPRKHSVHPLLCSSVGAILLPCFGRALTESARQLYSLGYLGNPPLSSPWGLHLVFLTPGLVVVADNLSICLQRYPKWGVCAIGGVVQGPDHDIVMRRWAKETLWSLFGFASAIVLLLATGTFNRIAGIK